MTLRLFKFLCKIISGIWHRYEFSCKIIT
ncbi:hypothetical protein F383_33079 [Gossypium arboreum]|uniref:Uncharacterized protein n=1 Tax=Gossypium arboreum TaxID=29729 RepID=A0A0B0PKR3_GOSAR|nr:hypothetical protein F383_33079 [Gossypium arboreum]